MNQGAPSLASLTVEPQGSTTLSMTLRDMAGATLAGPAILQKQPDLALTCP